MLKYKYKYKMFMCPMWVLNANVELSDQFYECLWLYDLIVHVSCKVGLAVVLVLTWSHDTLVSVMTLPLFRWS